MFLNDPNTPNVCLRRPIEPHDPSNVYLSIQCRTSNEVDEFEHGVRTVRLLSHLFMDLLAIDSEPTHRGGRALYRYGSEGGMRVLGL